MTKIAIGLAVVLGILATAFGYGMRVERAMCDKRIAIAEKRFSELEDHVKSLVEQYEQAVDLATKDKENAEKLKQILVRLQSTASEKCALDVADIADAGKL